MYLVGLHIYYKMIHGPYNVKLYFLSFDTVALKCPSSWSLCNPATVSFSVQHSSAPFSAWSDSPTLSQFINLQITLQLSCLYTNCVPHFQSLQYSYDCISSCHRGSCMVPLFARINSCIVCRPISLRITELVTSVSNLLLFFCIYCLKMTLPLQSTQ